MLLKTPLANFNSPGLVIEVAKESENVWVSQMRLDFDLSSELVLNLINKSRRDVFANFCILKIKTHLSLLQLGLEEDLEGHNVLAFLFSGQVHVPKFPFSQRTPTHSRKE